MPSECGQNAVAQDHVKMQDAARSAKFPAEIFDAAWQRVSNAGKLAFNPMNQITSPIACRAAVRSHPCIRRVGLSGAVQRCARAGILRTRAQGSVGAGRLADQAM